MAGCAGFPNGLIFCPVICLTDFLYSDCVRHVGPGRSVWSGKMTDEMRHRSHSPSRLHHTTSEDRPTISLAICRTWPSRIHQREISVECISVSGLSRYLRLPI